MESEGKFDREREGERGMKWIRSRRKKEPRCKGVESTGRAEIYLYLVLYILFAGCKGGAFQYWHVLVTTPWPRSRNYLILLYFDPIVAETDSPIDRLMAPRYRRLNEAAAMLSISKSRWGS